MSSPPNHLWHVDPDVLERYAAGDAGMVARSSVEAHLLACGSCRTAVATHRTGSSPVDSETWSAIADRIDRPRGPMRWATSATRVSLASPMLVAVTALVVIVLIGTAILLSYVRSRASLTIVVGLAPLAPVAAVVAAFRPELDPAGGLSVATPMAAGRLPFLRALFASIAALLAGLVATPFAPMPATEVVAWLLPGVAFAAVVLAAATIIDPVRVALVVAVGWLTVVGAWSNSSRRLPVDGALDDLVTASSWAQMACVAITLLAGVVVLNRRDELPDWRAA